MAFQKLRGEQLQDNIISNRHVKGQFTEEVLDINFKSHASEIFEEKKVVDYVQKNEVLVDVASTTITVELPTGPALSDEVLGIVLNKYAVRLRETRTAKPLEYNGTEVYAKLESHSLVEGKNVYTLTFYEKSSGTEKKCTIQADTLIDIVYPQRFTLDDVNETFAANEKFVDGATDVTTHLNITQIAKEVFGSYVLNNNGNINNIFGDNSTLVEKLVELTCGRINDTVKAMDIIDEVIVARSNKATVNDRFVALEQAVGEGGNLDQRLDDVELEISNARKTHPTLLAHMNALQSGIDANKAFTDDLKNPNDPKKGASLVAVDKTSAFATGLALSTFTVQESFAKLYQSLLDEVSNRADAISTHKNELASNLNGKGASLIGVEDIAGVFTATTVESVLKELDDKIKKAVTAINSSISDLDNKFTPTQEEVNTARGNKASLTERLDVSIDADGVLKDIGAVHKHMELYVVVDTNNVTSVNFTFPGTNKFNTPKSHDVFTLYINGIKHIKPVHWSVSVVDKVVTATVTEPLLKGDYVEICATIYAV